MSDFKSTDDTAKEVLRITQAFLAELKMDKAARAVSLQSHLDRDLGLDSLSKVELFHQLERAFQVSLPEQVLYEIQTLGALNQAILDAGPSLTREKKQYQEQLQQAIYNPSQAISLTEILQARANTEPDRPHIYLQDFDGTEQIITYGRLYQRATLVAANLSAMGIHPKDTVAIMLPTSEDFFISFIGILLIGAIPVPIYPPFRPDQIEEYALREAKILNQAQVRILITFHRVEKLSSILSIFVPSLKSVCNMGHLLNPGNPFTYVPLQSTDAALIQFTSGSTSTPKGVLLSQQNILSNIRLSGQAIQVTPQDVVISWLPLYHDMGLIGTWLGSFYFGVPACILSPMTFLTHPERWLWAVHYHRGTLSAAPNFAYELCVRRIQPEMIEGLDLSSWRLTFNGAEAVKPCTIKRFTQKFAPYGFRPQTMFPVYGLAESSVALVFPKDIHRCPVIDTIEREPFEKARKAQPAKANDPNTLQFVGVGQAIPEHEIKIVDDHYQPIDERCIGHLFFKGPSMMSGYYQAPEATTAAMHDGWIDSGDLAYIADGELYIVGRQKDIIIKAGRNYYPEEVEEITSQVPGIRKGCTVAFGVMDPRLGTEKLVVVTETRETDAKIKQHILQEVSEKIANILGNPPDEIILAPPKAVPKTSSGKLQRQACKKAYLSGKITTRKQPAWWQMLKLLVKAGHLKCIHGLKQCLDLIYSVWVYVVIAIGGLCSGILALLLPGSWLTKIMPYVARNMFRMALCPVHLKDQAHARVATPMIFVANHASYIDALVMMAVLPAGTKMVAKQELLKRPILGRLVQKLGFITVDRLDFADTIQASDKMLKTINNHQSLGLFPEGTFTYATGIRPFKLGAFKVSVDTLTPICPLAIQGTRAMYRAGKILFSPGQLKVTFCPPLYPNSDDWDEVVRLAEMAKQQISTHCGEPIINV